MALGLQTSSNGGDFLPTVRYDARAGRLFKIERAQGANGWESTPVDITNPAPMFAIDMGTIDVGWVHFSATGPNFVMVPLGQPLPAQPSKDHKQGFRVKLSGRVLDGVRELSATAKCVLASMDDLHTRYEAAPEAATGKIPVVKLAGTTAVVTKGPQGNTTAYAPVFEIVQWTERSPEMGERTVPAPGALPPKAAQPSNHVPPPTARPAEAVMPETWN